MSDTLEVVTGFSNPLESPRYKSTIIPAQVMSQEELDLLPNPLGFDPLLEIPVHLLAERTDDGTQFEAVFDTSFGGHEFSNFLYSVAPDRRYKMGEYGIIADWVLPDQPATQSRLLSLHQGKTDSTDGVAGIGRFFAEFEGSRYAFMRGVLHSVRERTVLDAQTQLVEEEVVRSQALALYQNHTKPSEMEQIANDLDLPPFKDRILQILTEHPDFERRRGYNPPVWAETMYEEMCSRRGGGKGGVKKDAYRSYRRSLDDEEIKRLIDYFTNDRLVELPRELTDNPSIFRNKTYYIEKAAAPEEPVRRVIDETTGATQEFARFRMPKFDPRGKLNKWGYVEIPIPGTFEEKHRFRLRPALKWIMDHSGNIQWIGDTPITPVTRAEAPQAGHYDSSLLGLLALAYLTPTLRKDERYWPSEMGLPGSRYKQAIGEVQVPVLALMRKKQLMQHPIVSTAHQLA